MLAARKKERNSPEFSVNNFYRNICIVTTLILVLLIDIFVKWFVVNFNLSYGVNRGIAFSFLSNSGNTRNISMVIAIMLFLIFYILGEIRYFNKLNLYQFIGLLLMACGGISNLIDRVIYGAVIDYIHLWRFPWFNLSDVIIVLGLALIVWNMLIGKSKTGLWSLK